MSLPIPGTNSIKDTGYDVAHSLRFNNDSSDYLNRTTTSPNSDRKYTFSCWVKRSSLGKQYIIADYGSSSNFSEFGFNGGDKLFAYQQDGGSTAFEVVTNRVFRDLSAWYHILYVFDSAQATDTNRIKFFVNGVEETSMSGTNYPSLNLDTRLNGNGRVYNIGQSGNNGNYFDGYLTEIVGLDNQALDPTSFGQFDSDTNIWKPKNVSGLTFGTNGFYLDFENSGSLGADVSGNGNNFTVNNLTSIDQSIDTCTNNFCTFNPLSADEMTFSQGNLKVVTASSPRNDDNARGTIGVNSGKWYWEIKTSGASVPAVIGICFDELKMGSDLSGLTGVYAIQNASGTFAYKRENGTTAETSGFPNPVNNDIINVALDCDNSKLYIGINGTYYNQAGSTGNPATGSNETFSGIDMSHFWLPFLEARSTDAQGEANFGGTDSFTVSSGNSDGNGYGNFEYAVPSGYYSLNTKNLAEFG